MEKEITSLNKVLKDSEKPVTAVLGGVKFQLKSPLLKIF